MTHTDPRTILLSVYQTAVNAAQPERCLPALLPSPPDNGTLTILACGKAAAAMAETAAAHYAKLWAADRMVCHITTRKGYGKSVNGAELIEAGHPVPDRESTQAAIRALELAGAAGADDLVLVLLSGGASALWAAPAEGLTLAEKQAITRALLRSGAPIQEMNSVRKHLSAIKGGRLAVAAAPARCITLAISDVPHDTADVIGSGPTVPDPTTLDEARQILRRYDITLPASVENVLARPTSETPKPGDPAFSKAEFKLAARPADAVQAAADKVAALGYRPILLGDALEGEAREVAVQHAALALEQLRGGERAAIISGGELTVTIKGDGRGGPNQEYALALALALDGAAGISALAADTDGSDGGTGRAEDPAGAMIFPDTLTRARNAGMDPPAYLTKNDSTGFFEMVDELVVSGPTNTNVNDLRVILVEPGVMRATEEQQ